MRTRKANCHPRKSKKRNTCYEVKDIFELRDEWNRKHPYEPIRSKDPKKIRIELDRGMKECNNELCWTKLIQDSTKKKQIIQKNFAVIHPNKWKENTHSLGVTHKML